MAKKSTAEKKSKRQGATIHEFPSSRRAQPAPRGPLQEPEPPNPKQHQPKPGLQHKMKPQPRYEGKAYRPAGKLKDKAALITGGDSGIGRAVAVLYAREGADVAIVHLAEEQRDAEETQAAVEKAGRRCLLIAGDVTDSDFCRNAVESTVEHFGHLDVLVNNAAFQAHKENPEDISDAQWEYTFRTNIFGYFYMVKAALPHLKEGSAIVNTGSITGLRGNKKLLDYSSTKGAIHAFTKSLAQMLAERKIRVNCVAPGPVWTPLIVSDFTPEMAEKQGQEKPFGRAAQPEEIAPAYVFFASEADSSYITGEVLTLLGGETTAA